MKIQIELTGTTPLLMHSDRAVDKLHPDTVHLRKMTEATKGKGKDTDENLMRLAHAEFLCGINCDDALGPFLYGQQVWKACVEGARLTKMGKTVERGLVIHPDSIQVPLQYDGPRAAQELWDAGWYHRCSVKVQMSRVMRTRPIFRAWSAKLNAEVADDVLKLDSLSDYLDTAGRLIGIGDGRSIGFGRFTAEVWK